MRKGSRVRYKKKSWDREAHNEACETDTAVRAAERDGDSQAGNTHPCSSYKDANFGAFILGCHCVPFRALILYACHCTRQTARDTAVLAAVEQMIGKEKGIQEQYWKLGYILKWCMPIRRRLFWEKLEDVMNWHWWLIDCLFSFHDVVRKDFSPLWRPFDGKKKDIVFFCWIHYSGRASILYYS